GSTCPVRPLAWRFEFFPWAALYVFSDNTRHGTCTLQIQRLAACAASFTHITPKILAHASRRPHCRVAPTGTCRPARSARARGWLAPRRGMDDRTRPAQRNLVARDLHGHRRNG